MCKEQLESLPLLVACLDTVFGLPCVGLDSVMFCKFDQWSDSPEQTPLARSVSLARLALLVGAGSDF